MLQSFLKPKERKKKQKKSQNFNSESLDWFPTPLTFSDLANYYYEIG